MLLRCARLLASLVKHDRQNASTTTPILSDTPPEETLRNVRNMRLIQHIVARLKHNDHQQPYLVEALAILTIAHGEQLHVPE